MDEIRSERNRLLKVDDKDDVTSHESAASVISSFSSTRTLSTHILDSNNNVNAIPLGISSLTVLYDSFFEWIEKQADNLFSSSPFSFASTLQEREHTITATTTTATRRNAVSFEALSPPTKNLILALGDVQLQKGIKDEAHMKELLRDLNSIAQFVFESLRAARMSLNKMHANESETKAALEQKITADMFQSREYMDAVETLNEIDSSIKQLMVNSHTNIPYVSFDKEINSRDQDQDKYALACKQVRRVKKTLAFLESKTGQLKDNEMKHEITSHQDIDDRLKLRIKKNEIAKQKLMELSRSSMSASNLATALETLRIAEQEVDEGIEILNRSILATSTIISENETISKLNAAHGAVNSSSSKAGAAASAANENANQTSRNIEDRVRLVELTLYSVGVKLRLLSGSIKEELASDMEKYQQELRISVRASCLKAKQDAADLFTKTRAAYESEVQKLKRSEQTLKTELQSLLRIIRQDSRGVEHCVRSVSDISKSRSESIELEYFSKHARFLETTTET